MAVHNLSWVATSSGVGATEVIHEALQWLTGGEAIISREKVKSYHGPKMTVVKAKVDRKKSAREAICHLGHDFLSTLASSDDLAERIDESNTLHIRLDLAALVSAEIKQSGYQGDGVVKGKIKLEVYPKQNCVEIARQMLHRCAERAEKENLPVQKML